MSRTPATITQADVARVMRAAKQAGAGTVEVRPDGTMVIHMGSLVRLNENSGKVLAPIGRSRL